MTIREQVTAESRQLTGILGKFVGGLTTVSGILAAVLGAKHDAQNSITLGAIALCAGIFLFVASSRWLAKRKAETAAAPEDPKSAWKQSALAWGLLACFVLLFLLFVQITTGI